MERFMGPIWVFGLALLYYLFYREKTKRRLHVFDLIHKERMQAIEKGLPYPELPPYTAEEEAQERPNWQAPSPRTLAGLGTILILGGAGALVALRLVEDEYTRSMWSMGFIPVFGGVGLLLHAWINRNQ